MHLRQRRSAGVGSPAGDASPRRVGGLVARSGASTWPPPSRRSPAGHPRPQHVRGRVAVRLRRGRPAAASRWSRRSTTTASFARRRRLPRRTPVHRLRPRPRTGSGRRPRLRSRLAQPVPRRGGHDRGSTGELGRSTRRIGALRGPHRLPAAAHRPRRPAGRSHPCRSRTSSSSTRRSGKAAHAPASSTWAGSRPRKGDPAPPRGGGDGSRPTHRHRRRAARGACGRGRLCGAPGVPGFAAGGRCRRTDAVGVGRRRPLALVRGLSDGGPGGLRGAARP